jgi:hypothetical protein
MYHQFLQMLYDLQVISLIFVNDISGYKGWGCTDGSKATPEGLLLLTTLLLTLSNVFFLPAVFLALRRHLLTEALIYLATMVFSTFYHACDQDFYTYCVTKYEVSVLCLIDNWLDKMFLYNGFQYFCTRILFS